MGWFSKNDKSENTVRLEIEASAQPGSYMVFRHEESFVIKIRNSDAFKELDNMVGLIDVQTFAIFKNDTDFYIRVVPPNYRFKDLAKYLDSGYWTECYVFGDKEIMFPAGVEYIFANRLLNHMRKYVSNASILNTYCNDGNPSNLLSIVEQNEYENFWNNIKTILQHNNLNITPIDKEDSLDSFNKKSLFNVDFKTVSNEPSVSIRGISHAIKSGYDDLIEYSLEDSSGVFVYASSLEQLFVEWVKELCKIPAYKKTMFEIADYQAEHSTTISRLLFTSSSRYYGLVKIIENLYLVFYKDTIDNRTILISEKEIKKRIITLASLLGIHVNIDKKTIFKVSDIINNPNSAEVLEHEKMKRNENRTLLVEKLEKFEKEDFDKFIECSLNSYDENDSETALENYHRVDLKNSQVLTNENPENVKDEHKEIDREKQALLMMYSVSDLRRTKDQEFNKIFKNN